MKIKYWVEFFDDLQNVRGRSLNTIRAYRHDLELYEEFLKTHKDISLIYSFLNKKKLSLRSQARIISSLRTYFKFCELRGELVYELKFLNPPKVKTRLPKGFSLDEFNKLYEASVVSDKYQTARNQITLVLLFSLGCRVSELIGLTTQDYNSTESWVSVTGKGEKQRLIPLTDHLHEELKFYLKEIRPHLGVRKTNSILINDRGRRPSRVDIWRWLSTWSKKAGFKTTIHPHRFRHACATSLLESGADLRSIQLLLGHSSIQTTQIYTSVSRKHLEKEIAENHPLSGIKE